MKGWREEGKGGGKERKKGKEEKGKKERGGRKKGRHSNYVR